MKRQILVVHNDREIRDTLVVFLKKSFEVILADDGIEAWEIFTSRDIYFDIIITDLILPRMNGSEFIKRVREVNYLIPVIAVTNKSTRARAEEAANLGVSAYMSHPFDLESLLDKINTILDRFNLFGSAKVYLDLLKEMKITKKRLIVQQVLTEVNKKFNKRICLNDIAGSLSISKEHLCRIFKKNCGVTLYVYIKRMKIKKTIDLLNNTDYSLDKIAEMIGFYDTSHLIRTFKKTLGVPPRKFIYQSKKEGDKDLLIQ